LKSYGYMFLLDHTQRQIAETVGITQSGVGFLIRDFKRDLADELGIEMTIKGGKK